MKIFKIILAAFVIFAAGVVTGAMVSRKASVPPVVASPAPSRSSTPPPGIGWSKERKAEYVARLDKYLQLSPEQKKEIEEILDQSNHQMAEYWAWIEPQVKEEYRACRKRVSEVLSPEQRKKQEEWRALKNKQKSQSSASPEKLVEGTQKLVPDAK